MQLSLVNSCDFHWLEFRAKTFMTAIKRLHLVCLLIIPEKTIHETKCSKSTFISVITRMNLLVTYGYKMGKF